MKQNLSTFLILTIAMFIGFNCIKLTPTPGPRPPAKSDSEKCEPKWYKKNKTWSNMATMALCPFSLAKSRAVRLDFFYFFKWS